LFNLAVHNAVERRELGVATSAGQFFRQIGSTIGVAVFGAVLTHNLMVMAPKASVAHEQVLSLAELERMALASQTDGSVQSGGSKVALDPVVRDTVSEAIKGVMFAGFLVSILGLLATGLIPELPLKSFRDPEPLGEAPGEPPREPSPE